MTIHILVDKDEVLEPSIYWRLEVRGKGLDLIAGQEGHAQTVLSIRNDGTLCRFAFGGIAGLERTDDKIKLSEQLPEDP